MTRPRWHFTPEVGWINDPLGVTYRDGVAHLYFQHVPGRPTWDAACHWGHAESRDLAHWAEQPIALSPDADETGCWSGSVADAGDSPTLFYTSVTKPDLDLGVVRTASPTDRSLRAWLPGPVVVRPPADLDLAAFRDPYVYEDGDCWRMVVGAGLADGTAAALVYRSTDLVSWAYEGVLASRRSSPNDGVWTGSVWECPQLFALGDRHVLVVSVWDDTVEGHLHHVAAAIGSYADGRFEAERWQRLTYGPAHYAPCTYLDADGRRGLIHWLRGIADPGGAWAGALSVPHVLSLESGRVVARPHPAVDSLDRTGPYGGPAGLDGEWSPSAHGLAISSSDGASVAALSVQGSTLRVEIEDDSWSMPFDGGCVRVLIDGPVLELFTRTGVFGATVRPTSRLGVTGASWRPR